MPAVAAQRQGGEHLAAHLVIVRVAQRGSGRAGHRLKSGGQIDGAGAKAETGGKPAKPGAAADPLAKVGDQFHILGPVAQPRAPVLRPRRRAGSQRIRHPQRHGRAALLKTDLAILKQTRDPQGHLSAATPANRICARAALVKPMGLKPH